MIDKLRVGDHFTVGRFTCKRVSGVDYILRDANDKERARWGTRKEIAADLAHALMYDTLPPVENERW